MKKKILDITSYKCPVVYIKAKEFLKKFSSVKTKTILIKGSKNHDSLVQTLKASYKLKSKKIGDQIYEINLKD